MNSTNRKLGIWAVEKRPSVPGAILETFRRRFSTGEYTPGSRLPTIEELAGEFGVSKGSIREAIRALQVVGLVEVRHGDGIYVASADAEYASIPLTWGLIVTAQTQQELIQVRQILEIAASDFAARHARVVDLAALRDAVERLRNAPDVDSATESDLDFHVAVAHASGNRILMRLLRGIRDLLRPVFKEALAKPQVRERVAAQHQAVLDAVVAADPEGAKRAMTEHISFVAEIWLGFRADPMRARDDQ